MRFREGQTVYVDFAQVSRPVRLLERVTCWGEHYWHGEMSGVPIYISEARLKEVEAGRQKVQPKVTHFEDVDCDIPTTPRVWRRRG